MIGQFRMTSAYLRPEKKHTSYHHLWILYYYYEIKHLDIAYTFILYN